MSDELRNNQTDANNQNPAGQTDGSGGETPNIEEMKKQLEEAQRKITELAQVNATLEKRFQEINPQPQPQTQQQPQQNIELEIKEALEMIAEGDVEDGYRKFNEAMQKRDYMLYNSMAGFVETTITLKEKEKEVLNTKPYLASLKPQIEARMTQLIQTGKNPVEALDQAVNEFDAVFKNFQQTQPQQQQEPNPPKVNTEYNAKNEEQPVVETPEAHLNRLEMNKFKKIL